MRRTWVNISAENTYKGQNRIEQLYGFERCDSFVAFVSARTSIHEKVKSFSVTGIE